MTDTIAEHAAPDLHKGEPLVEMEDVGKAYGAILLNSWVRQRAEAMR